MKPTVTFKHVWTAASGRVKIYKASKVLTNKANGKKYKSVREPVRFYRTKERSRDDLITRHIPTCFQYVAVSDAHTHIERLAFPCWRVKPLDGEGACPYFWITDTIAGVNTFMIHGGDSRAVKPIGVYLRMLAKANGFQYTKFID